MTGADTLDLTKYVITPLAGDCVTGIFSKASAGWIFAVIRNEAISGFFYQFLSWCCFVCLIAWCAGFISLCVFLSFTGVSLKHFVCLLIFYSCMSCMCLGFFRIPFVAFYPAAHLKSQSIDETVSQVSFSHFYIFVSRICCAVDTNQVYKILTSSFVLSLGSRGQSRVSKVQDQSRLLQSVEVIGNLTYLGSLEDVSPVIQDASSVLTAIAGNPGI